MSDRQMSRPGISPKRQPNPKGTSDKHTVHKSDKEPERKTNSKTREKKHWRNSRTKSHDKLATTEGGTKT